MAGGDAGAGARARAHERAVGDAGADPHADPESDPKANDAGTDAGTNKKAFGSPDHVETDGRADQWTDNGTHAVHERLRPWEGQQVLGGGSGQRHLRGSRQPYVRAVRGRFIQSGRVKLDAVPG